MNFPQILPILLGVLILIVTIPGIIYPAKVMKIFSSILENENVLRFVGLHNAMLGLLLMLMWSYYVDGIYILLPLIGAVIFFASISFVWIPDIVYKKIYKPVFKWNEEKIRFAIFLKVLFAMLLIYLGWDY